MPRTILAAGKGNIDNNFHGAVTREMSCGNRSTGAVSSLQIVLQVKDLCTGEISDLFRLKGIDSRSFKLIRKPEIRELCPIHIADADATKLFYRVGV